MAAERGKGTHIPKTPRGKENLLRRRRLHLERLEIFQNLDLSQHKNLVLKSPSKLLSALPREKASVQERTRRLAGGAALWLEQRKELRAVPCQMMSVRGPPPRLPVFEVGHGEDQQLRHVF